MKILGIDPGVCTTGWAIIQENSKKPLLVKSGYFSLKKIHNFSDKLFYIHENLSDLIRKNSISECAIENPFVNINPKTSLLLSQFKGALLLTMTIHNIRVTEYQPSSIKRVISGNGRCEKRDLKSILKYHFPYISDNIDHNEVDAIAITLSHYYSINYRHNIKQ